MEKFDTNYFSTGFSSKCKEHFLQNAWRWWTTSYFVESAIFSKQKLNTKVSILDENQFRLLSSKWASSILIGCIHHALQTVQKVWIRKSLRSIKFSLWTLHGFLCKNTKNSFLWWKRSAFLINLINFQIEWRRTFFVYLLKRWKFHVSSEFP